MKRSPMAVLVGLLFAFAACGGDPAEGPGRVAWDRDACEHCQMLISDPAFAAQVRGADGRLRRFDDPGCAVLWLRGAAASGPPQEVWVHDHEGDIWLDAREARFVSVRNSPMGWGYAARPAANADGIDFETLKREIMATDDARRSPGR